MPRRWQRRGARSTEAEPQAEPLRIELRIARERLRKALMFDEAQRAERPTEGWRLQ
jgi:hypothetical protein